VRVNSIPGAFVPGTLVSIWSACLALGCVLAASCGDSNAPSKPRTVEVSRVIEGSATGGARTSDTAERFGVKSVGSGSASTVPQKSDEISADLALARNAIAWVTPAGWTELPPTNMRLANFRADADGKVECYLTILAGDAGGLLANVNRWRAQMSLAPIAKAELDALPRQTFFEREGVLVDFSGTWKGMNAEGGVSDSRLLGVLLNDPSGSAFLKLTGPAAQVAEQHTAFLALAASFKPKGQAPAAQSGPTESAGGFEFRIPSGWRRGPDRASRAFTLLADDTDLECYVTLLAGDAGGELANINRWRGQLQLPALADGVVGSLPKIAMLGGEALLVEAQNALDGGTQLLGAVACGPERSVFVKLSGKSARVEAQRAAFLEFCKSLEHAP
jgi:hypothetical protein